MAPGKSLFRFSVPCQVIVQPPFCLPILSAPSPVTKICWLGLSGSNWSLFFNNTNDFRTASRATARCSEEPIIELSDVILRSDGAAFSNIPARSLTRRIRLTASSIRDIGISPLRTWASVFFITFFQSAGAIIISTPAFIDWAQLWLVQPSTWPIPFQSLITNPSKPI